LRQAGFFVMLGGMNARKLQRLKKDLDAYVADIASGIGRSERKFWCETCLRGLLLEARWVM
jgi:hypothetical protein